MVTNKTYEYGIKYKMIKIDSNSYFMHPLSIEGGLSDGYIFSTEDRMIPIVNNKNSLKYKYVMDNIYATEDLEKMYDYEEDTEFLANYFYNEFKDVCYLIKVDDNNELKKYAIDLNDFKNIDYSVIYQMNKGKPSITLNHDILNELLACKSEKDIKILLLKYKALINKFNKYSKENGITRVHVKDGKISSFDTKRGVIDIDKDIEVSNVKKERKENKEENEITFKGLLSAIKEKIIGHDDQVEEIADTLYMNYSAKDGESVDSILLVGPTGTGKTATVMAACDYLKLPFASVNTANLVTSGIKGVSIEKVLKELYDKAGQDLKKAERGVVFLDEFDKLARTSLDIKEPVKDILLSFSDGADIQVIMDDVDFIFNSKMTNKIYAGVFEDINKVEKRLGFGVENKSTLLEDGEKIRQQIIDKKYYTQEDISRITKILPFNELTKEDKKRILLTSKLSAYAMKKARYKRQFGIDMVADEDYIDALLEQVSSLATGMRSVNNIVRNSVTPAEIEILRNEEKGYKRLVLTKDTIINPKNFDLS